VQGSQSSEIDFILANGVASPTETQDTNLQTDHKILVTTVTLEKSWEKVSKNYTTATLKKNAHKEKLDEVFLDESWPEKPFIEVAKSHGLT
jgi:hypothetical protein